MDAEPPTEPHPAPRSRLASRGRPRGRRPRRPARGTRPARAARRRSTGTLGRNLPLAIASGVGLAATFLVTLFWSPWAFLTFVAVIIVLALLEIDAAFRTRGLRPATPVAIGAGLVMFFGAYSSGPSAQALGLVLLGLGTLAWAVLDPRGRSADALPAPLDVVEPEPEAEAETAVAAPGETGRPETDRPETGRPETDRPETGRPETDRPETGRPETGRPETGRPEIGRIATGRVGGNVGATCLMTLWVPFLASFLGLLLARPEGRWAVMGTVALAVTNDIGAFAFGSRWGKTRMAPSVSPAKSWEGFFGGLGTALVVAGVVTSRVPGFDLTLALALALGVVIAATIGDLAESLVKRDLGIKDLGRMIPGHGGIMDRVDALLFALPVGHLVLSAFGA